MDLTSPIRLANGASMPRLALGTFKAKGGEVKEAVKAALAAGYRHIDTASVYKNEAEIGEAIREYGIAREEVFITSKASPYEHGFQQALAACAASLERLQTEYLDLYLLHWPGVAKLDRASEKNAEIRLESWRALEQLQREGKCRAIGVSNFTAAHLDHLITNSAAPPAVNQVEVHPLLTQQSLRAYCAERGICVAAYSPLGCGQLLQHPIVQQVAMEVEWSPAQVLLRWSIQHGMVTIPKSVSTSRVAENADIFDFSLDKEKMDKLDSLDEDRHFCWSPIGIA